MSAPEISVEALVSHLLQMSRGVRTLVGIAGPPGVGKSTFCDQLCAALNVEQPGTAAILPMDGFHYDNEVLKQKGWKARKGAPHTFDVGGLYQTLGRLKKNIEEFVAVPVFDRELEIARAGARIIPRQVKIILVEGNYLLLNQNPWRDVRLSFDMSVMLLADLDVLETRLNKRWQGLGMSPKEIRQKLLENDLPNAHQVLDFSSQPDFVMRTDEPRRKVVGQITNK